VVFEPAVTVPTDVAGGAGAEAMVVGAAAVDSAAAEETGQTVVERTTVSVVSEPILAGQFVTVAAQEVMVYTVVVQMVEVVMAGGGAALETGQTVVDRTIVSVVR